MNHTLVLLIVYLPDHTYALYRTKTFIPSSFPSMTVINGTFVVKVSISIYMCRDSSSSHYYSPCYSLHPKFLCLVRTCYRKKLSQYLSTSPLRSLHYIEYNHFCYTESFKINVLIDVLVFLSNNYLTFQRPASLDVFTDNPYENKLWK